MYNDEGEGRGLLQEVIQESSSLQHSNNNDGSYLDSNEDNVYPPDPIDYTQQKNAHSEQQEDEQENQEDQEEIQEEEQNPEPIPEKPIKQRTVNEEKKIKRQLRAQEEYNRQLAEKLAQLENENLSLKNNTVITGAAAALLHKEKIEMQVSSAKELLRSANEAGDIDQIVEAQQKLLESQAALIDAKKELDIQAQHYSQIKKYQEEAAKQPQQPQQYSESQGQYPQPNDYQKRNYAEWVRNNSWFNAESNDYDEELAADVIDYAELLSAQYNRKGMNDRVLSPEYFDDIDKYMRLKFRQNTNNYPTNNRGQQAAMKTSIKGSYSGASAKKPSKLSSDHLESMRRLGLTEEQYRLALKKARDKAANSHSTKLSWSN